MRRAFHADATIFGYEGDSLFAGPIQRLFDWNDQNGPAADLHATIVSIDVAGTIATVRLELDNWTGTIHPKKTIALVVPTSLGMCDANNPHRGRCCRTGRGDLRAESIGDT
jgi:Putative lumazine-binding